MAEDAFDPEEHLEEPGHPLQNYLRPPWYLGAITALQFVLAGLTLVLALTVRAAGGGGLLLGSLALMALVFAASGTGLLRRRGWGWWITAALHYCVFFNLPVNLILWTLEAAAFPLATHLVTFGLAVAVLACLTRPELLRFIRFSTPDARPTRRMFTTPVLVAAAWSAVHLVVALVRM